MVNVYKLTREIVLAGLPCVGVSSSGGGGDEYSVVIDSGNARADFPRALTPAELTALAGVVAAHDPTDRAAARSAAAEGVIAAIPGWALWTQVDWADWHSQHLGAARINALAIPQGAKDVLNDVALAILNIGKFAIAIRDRLFPDLLGL